MHDTKDKRPVPDYAPFANALSKLLEQSGMTNTAFAAAIDVKPSSVTYYRHGQQMPDCIRLKKIADVLHTTTDYLLGRAPDPTTQVYWDSATKAHMLSYLNKIICSAETTECRLLEMKRWAESTRDTLKSLEEKDLPDVRILREKFTSVTVGGLEITVPNN